MPGEPAYHLVQQWLDSEPIEAEVSGCLLVRDGLPFLNPDSAGNVSGYLLTFATEFQGEAYETVGRYEPKGHYKWSQAPIQANNGLANCVVGRMLAKGRATEYDGSRWTFKKDPVFLFGLQPVAAVTRSKAAQEFQSAPPDSFDWERFFHLQMAYLLLWAAIERYASLSFGPELDPTDKLKRLAEDSDFRQALAERVSRTGEVYDARDPETVYRLDRGNPTRSILYYYQVRSNLAHRGKGAWADGEIVRQSLLELSAVFSALLKAKGVNIGPFEESHNNSRAG